VDVRAILGNGELKLDRDITYIIHGKFAFYLNKVEYLLKDVKVVVIDG